MIRNWKNITSLGPVAILALLIFTLLNFISFRYFFFWDTVQLASHHAHFYYDNHFSSFFLPNDIDSGHPPFFGMSLALLWSLFGRTLWVSHLFMLPFLWGIIWQIKGLVEKLFQKKFQSAAFVLLLLQPTFLGQAVLVSPDVVLYCCMLLLLNSHLEGNRKKLAVAIIGLSMISMRGWMVAFVFYLFEALYCFITQKKFTLLVRLLVPYIPGAIIAIGFLLYHYLAKGWIGYHDDSPWAGSFERVNFTGIIYNIGLYVWRLIDFGMISVFATLFILLLFYRTSVLKRQNLQKIGLLFIIMAVLLPSSMLLHKYLMAHRYLLPVLFLALLVTVYLVFEITPISDLKKQLIGGVLAISLIGGHFIVYPDTIAQAWDSSLAHVPYYALRKQALHYMAEQNIPIAKTGTFFPNLSSPRSIDLLADTTRFAKFDTVQNAYVFYSNVFNDITDEQYTTLWTKWEAVKTFEKRRVKIVIFQHPEPGKEP